MQNTQQSKLMSIVRIIIILVLIAIVSCAQLLFQSGLPHTPNEDLARHVALALNFREALEQGQYIPRLQPHPKYLPDIPVYQYYGFLASAFSQVGLWLHLPASNSVILGVVLCRSVGLVAIFFSLKLIGVSGIASLIACSAYIFFPYIQTNLYGRVAIPEACAHGFLPVLLVGFVYALMEKKGLLAVVFTALSIVFLALSHPIFLLWGVVSGLVLAFTSLWMNKECRYRVFALLIVGLMLGLVISSFQWYPAFISSGDLNINLFQSTPYNNAYLTSFSGFHGFPKSFIKDGTRYYFTGTIWVLPVIGLSVLLRRKISDSYKTLKVLVVSSLANLLIFLTLSISPFNIWDYMPITTYATQFPYRLLSLVGLFSSILLGLVLDKMIKSSRMKIALGVLTIVSSGMSLVAPGNIYGSRLLHQSDTEILSIFSSMDYVISENAGVATRDGWLIKDNLLHLQKSESCSVTLRGHLGGIVDVGDLSLWFVNQRDNNSIVSDVFIVNEDPFEHTFTIRGAIRDVRLISSKYVRPSDIDPKSGDSRLLSVMIDGLHICCGSDKLLIPSEITREVIGGYKRKFFVNKDLVQRINMTHSVVLTLPLAYSKFVQLTQNGQKLDALASSQGLAMVKVDNISDPIYSVFRLPLIVTIISGTSLVLFLILTFYLFFCHVRIIMGTTK